VDGRDRRARAGLRKDAPAAEDLDARDLVEQQCLQRHAGGGRVAAVDRTGEGGRALQAVHRLRDVAAGGGLVVDARGDRAERGGDRSRTARVGRGYGDGRRRGCDEGR